MGDLGFHEACLLFPPLGDEELQALADDIKERGLLHPITTHEGLILDGRNRLLACKKAGVEPTFEEWTGTGTGSALEWAISTNLHRRHLTPSQRAVLALDMLPMLEDEAKDRQRRSPGRGKKVAKELATSFKRGKSSQFAAKLTGTNSAYVEQVKSVKRKAPELLDQVRSGSLTASEANRLSKLDTFQREKFFAAKAEQPNEKFNRLIRQVLAHSSLQSTPTNGDHEGRIDVWCGDCLDIIRDTFGDECIDVICTSPPFNLRKNYGTYEDDLDPVTFAAWLDEVFQQLHRVLKPNGSLFVIVGHTPRRCLTPYNMLRELLTYFAIQNQIVWVKAISINGESHGHFTPIPGDLYLNRNWDFVYHLTKNGDVTLDRRAVGVPYTEPNNAIRFGDGADVRCAGDVWFIPFETIHFSDERAHHPATFPQALVERCLKMVGYNENTILLDPFCGVNGLKAARKLGINAIGIDLDPQYCEAAARHAGVTAERYDIS